MDTTKLNFLASILLDPEVERKVTAELYDLESEELKVSDTVRDVVTRLVLPMMDLSDGATGASEDELKRRYAQMMELVQISDFAKVTGTITCLEHIRQMAMTKLVEKHTGAAADA